MQLDRHRLAFCIGGFDLLCRRNVVDVDDVVIKLARMRVALGRALMVIEGHARADNIEQRETTMHQRALKQRDELLLVTRKAPGDVGRAETQCSTGRIDRFLIIRLTLLGFAADVCRGRKLAFGQAIDAVVLDHVAHIHIAANRMDELANADRQGVAIPGHTDISQVSVRRICAGCH